MRQSDRISIQNIFPIIMAGGRGERLAPMTDTVPKPLLPIDGIPAICRALRLLFTLGFRRAAITLGYRAEDIKRALGSSCEGVSLSYTVENEPLGTAGGVLAAWDTYAKKEDTCALVFSGDAVFSLDLAAFLAKHEEMGADATLLSAHVSDPSQFGVLVCAEDGRIRAFCEKPDRKEAPSDLVNTGIYLLSRAFLSTLPRSRFLDFGRDVFPYAAKSGCALYAHITDGYWCDIGTPETFLLCTTALSSGALGPYSPLLLPKTARPMPHIHRSAIGARCHISASADIADSVLFDGVFVGRETRVTDAIVCRGVRIGKRAVIGAGAILGEGAVIEDGVTVPPGARIAPYTVVRGAPKAQSAKLLGSV